MLQNSGRPPRATRAATLHLSGLGGGSTATLTPSAARHKVRWATTKRIRQMSAPKRRNWIGRQFAARPVEMLESPAMRVLTLAERRALDRIEIEYAHHGGADNGKLPITYADFERFGLHPNVIAPSLRTLAALGFIEVTRKGYGGAAGVRAPSWYRLTYRSAWNATHRDGDGTTNIWRSRRSKRPRPSRRLRAAALITATSSGRRRAKKIKTPPSHFEEFRPRKRRAKRKIPALTFRGYRLTLGK